MELVLHIGAHRTGSTLIERALAATVAARPDCGVTVWGPKHLRKLDGFQAAIGNFDTDGTPLGDLAAEQLQALASRLAADLAAEQAKGTKVLIVSEENFIGQMRKNMVTGLFYPRVVWRLRCFDSLLPRQPDRVAMAVRNYATFWASIYRYLPQIGKKVPPLELAKGYLCDRKRGWPDVVADIRGVWPDADMLMWTQEDLSGTAAQVCAALMGVDVEDVVLPDERLNASAAPDDRPDPFTQPERKHLNHRYNRHLRRMQSPQSGVHWIGEAA